jgi:hypothetical protein
VIPPGARWLPVHVLYPAVTQLKKIVQHLYGIIMVWPYGAPSTPRQCVPVTEGGGFIQHLPDARSLRRAGQSALVRGWVCLCGRWKLYELMRAHTAKVINILEGNVNLHLPHLTAGRARSLYTITIRIPSGQVASARSVVGDLASAGLRLRRRRPRVPDGGPWPVARSPEPRECGPSAARLQAQSKSLRQSCGTAVERD